MFIKIYQFQTYDTPRARIVRTIAQVMGENALPHLKSFTEEIKDTKENIEIKFPQLVYVLQHTILTLQYF